MNSYYENHESIKKNKLCPFKLVKSYETTAVPCNWHKNIEMLLIIEGEGNIQYSTESLKLAADDIIIINSGILHRPYSDTGISYYYLIIDDTFCSENGIDVIEFTFEKKFRSDETRHKFEDIITKMGEYEECQNPISIVGLRSAVLALLTDLCTNHAFTSRKNSSQTSASEEYVKRVLEHINKNYTDSICLESLAELCGITKFHLAREFKKHTGQTVFTYINTLRCQNAEHCISNGMSVTEAAYASGFDSLSYFSRTYKKRMGTPPSRTK